MRKLACAVVFSSLTAPGIAQMPAAQMAQIIRDVAEGRWPAFISIAHPGGPSFDITTPSMKIAVAAATAIEQNRPFAPTDVTPEMLSLDIDVTRRPSRPQ